MLIDLLDVSNYGTYNITIANRFGIELSIYLSQILKQVNTNVLDKEGFVQLDRESIKQVTTFDVNKQTLLDKELCSLEVLTVKKKAPDSIIFDTVKFASIIMCEDEKFIQDTSKLVKTNTKKGSKEYIVKSLKEKITTSNDELKAAYCDWIDAVMAKENWMSVAAVVAGQKALDSYNTTRDLDVALKILEIASVNGYRDITWAINTFKQQYKGKFNFTPVINTTQQPVENIKLGKAF